MEPLYQLFWDLPGKLPLLCQQQQPQIGRVLWFLAAKVRVFNPQNRRVIIGVAAQLLQQDGFVHALISGGVEYADLGLVVTDEQHRFGVNQRAALAGKGPSPHTLVMSATPIPRTLALILYGDLDVSVIDELPPGRRPIETVAVSGGYHERIYGFIRRLVGEGRQAYIVCPMVEADDEQPDERKAVTEYADMP